MKICSLVFLLFIAAFTVTAQKTIVKGIVKDKNTGTPLSFVTVAFEGTTSGGVTEEDGSYRLETELHVKAIRFTFMGYETISMAVVPGKEQNISIALTEERHTLSEVTISGNNGPRYRNKDNPAVELIRLVIDHKDDNRKRGSHTFFEQYEKLQLSLSQDRNTPDKKKVLKKYPFMTQHADTLTWPDKALYPIFLEEKATAHKITGKTKEIIPLGEQKTRVDKFVDNDGLESYLKKIYIDVDLNDANIKIGDQQLLSPVAGLAPSFYKFFIVDTAYESGKTLVQLYFAPRNKSDRLFKGRLWITLDGHYALKKAVLSLDKSINLNWIDNFKVAIDYESDDSGHYYLSRNKMDVELSLLRGNRSLAGTRTRSVRKFKTADYPLPEMQTGTLPEVPKLTEVEWNTLRPEPLGGTEEQVYQNIDSLQKTRSFRRTMDIASLLLSGYKQMGLVEIGPVNSFYSFNPVEGFRLRLGGRTTDELSKKVSLQAHAAYGFKDERWKYAASITYSLTNRSIFQFPVRSIVVSRSEETMIPGQDLAFVEEDNFLLSFKRGKNDKWLYDHKWTIEYFHETRNHLSFRAGYRYSHLEGAGAIVFRQRRNDPSRPENEMIVSEFTGSVRWAPFEQFYQGKKFRKPIINEYPVFTLRGTSGFKGFLQGRHTYLNLALNIYKRFYLSQLGFTDVTLEGGKIFGKVPYPLMNIHRANQSYAYQLNSYNMMNFLEFISDQYVSLNLDHSFNGFLFNKIPLLKQLHLREAASVKVLYGSRSVRNLSANKGDVQLPADHAGKPLSYSLSEKPYVEASVGISNIFKLLRIDVVKRLTYLDHPDVTEWGIRARINLDF